MRAMAWVGVALAMIVPVTAKAQITEWRPDIIAKYESHGGKNEPNFKYDGPQGHYTAGGPCQMTNTNWRRIAPMIDIDIGKYDVAGTATEFDQWRACWKLWSLDGYSAWTCCNAKLRQALNNGEVVAPPLRRRDDGAEPPTTVAREKRQNQPSDRVAFLNARLAASSDVYHTMVASFH